jgi:phosphate:Na+ symporter
MLTEALTPGIAIDALGGLALFLLAMLLMTEGLTVFAGSGLRTLLGRWTRTPLRGVFAGILVTGVVQSSSAVTVAAIGFVNAGVMTLRQSLGVIFGTNVGTTMTGWLVSLMGFGVKIDILALPILTLGVILRLGFSSKRTKGLGMALAGFGLFFLGLAILKDAFAGMAQTYGQVVAQGEFTSGIGPFLLIGFVATVLTQSSSAAIAIILTAAAGGMVGIESAAAAVIGANLGTTSTALIAVLKATPNAKRLAVAHIAFNALTGAVALGLLPVLLLAVEALGSLFDIQGSPAAVLALFHTVFNVLGVLIMLPLARILTRALELLFRSAEEDMSRPKHLDATLSSTPVLAVAALRHELVRLRSMVTAMMQAALSGTAPREELEAQAGAVHALGEAVSAFVAGVRTETMTRAVADELAEGLFATRYLQEAARLAPHLLRLRHKTWQLHESPQRAALEEALNVAGSCLGLAARVEEEVEGDRVRAQCMEKFESAYHGTKKALLDAAVLGDLSVQTTDSLLDHLSSSRRSLQQLIKGDRLLRTPVPAGNGPQEKSDRTGEGDAATRAEGTPIRGEGAVTFGPQEPDSPPAGE